MKTTDLEHIFSEKNVISTLIDTTIDGIEISTLRVNRVKLHSPLSQEQREQNKKFGGIEETYNYYAKLKNGKELLIENRKLTYPDFVKELRKIA